MATAPCTSNVAAHRQPRQAARLLLDKGSLCDHQEGEWRAALYPNVGELVAVRIPWQWEVARPHPPERYAAPAEGNTNGLRAKTKARRYVKENQLRVLGTLTYAEEPLTRREVDQHVSGFIRRGRKLWGRLPLIFVIEEGTLRGRFHIHFAAPRRLPFAEVYGAWGRGGVRLSDRKGHQAAQRRGPDGVGAYLAKYIAKDVDLAVAEGPRARSRGAPRYHVTRGFQPVCKRRRFRDQASLIAWSQAYYGVGGRPYRFGDWHGAGICGLVIRYYDDTVRDWQHPGPEWFGISGTAAP